LASCDPGGLPEIGDEKEAAGQMGFGRIVPPFGGSKILCVGRNYKPHVEELGHTVPAEPLWFTKPPSSLLGHGGTVLLPKAAGRIDYEGNSCW
jgi:2-keto-4-pentenoate hydratase/2-oxohepta-3-ene-1,7-dioic acid hydratase in catechol pathway